jgi:hypothetical protein
MAFTVKNWQDSPSTATPLSATALEDMEDRLSDYTDTELAPVALRTAGMIRNVAEPWYGDWTTIGNTGGSIGFAGTPTAAPSTTVGTGGVTLPLTNGTVPITDTAQLSANGGSFTLGGHVIVYSGRSTSSGAGNATGAYTTGSATGTYTAGTALGFTSIGYGPLTLYEKFGDYTTNTNMPIPGTTQVAYLIAAYHGPTVDDSMEGLSVLAAAKDTGTGFVQHRPITAFEAISQLEGQNTLPEGVTAPLLAAGARTMVIGDSHAKTVIGFKLSHNTVGSDFGFTDEYYGLYQPTSAVVTYTTLNGAVAGGATSIVVTSGAAMPAASSAYPVTVQVGANVDGIGGIPITYTGVSTNTLTGVTGVPATGLVTGIRVQNNAASMNVQDRLIIKAGLGIGDSGFSGNTTLALRGGSDADGSVLHLSSATNTDISGGQTLLRITAGTGQTKQLFKMYDSSGTNRFSVSAAGAAIINGQGVILQTSGTTTAVCGNGEGYIQPGTSTTRGGSNAIGSKINSGSGAPAYSAALGDMFIRTDTPSTALQRIYICTTASTATVGAWTGIA